MAIGYLNNFVKHSFACDSRERTVLNLEDLKKKKKKAGIVGTCIIKESKSRCPDVGSCLKMSNFKSGAGMPLPDQSKCYLF